MAALLRNGVCNLQRTNELFRPSVKCKKITRLPSNLRATIRECVYLVTRGHFRSRDKDGGHTIQSAIAKKTHAIPKLYGSIFYRTGVIVDGFILRE